jgi:hypothetical protein
VGIWKRPRAGLESGRQTSEMLSPLLLQNPLVTGLSCHLITSVLGGNATLRRFPQKSGAIGAPGDAPDTVPNYAPAPLELLRRSLDARPA